MARKLLIIASLSFAALAQPAIALEALNEESLAAVSGRDGVSFAVSLRLNSPDNPNPVADSRLTTGYTVGGQQQYLVIKNLRGSIDMFVMRIDVAQRSDGGGDYVAIGLPGYLKFGHFGYESLSAETDPRGPITGNLGRFEIDGTMNLRGQFRFWTQ